MGENFKLNLLTLWIRSALAMGQYGMDCDMLVTRSTSFTKH